jgi:hypothetical protein
MHVEPVVGCNGLPAALHPEALHRGPASLSKYSLQSLVLPVHEDPSPLGDDPYKMVKLALDSCKIAEDVGMIELKII